MLVHGELDGREGDGHHKRGRVGDVECGEAFGAVDGARAGEERAELRFVDLHALLDDCKV